MYISLSILNYFKVDYKNILPPFLMTVSSHIQTLYYAIAVLKSLQVPMHHVSDSISGIGSCTFLCFGLHLSVYSDNNSPSAKQFRHPHWSFLWGPENNFIVSIFHHTTPGICSGFVINHLKVKESERTKFWKGNIITVFKVSSILENI